MTSEDFHEGHYEPGYKYELIDGRLYVSPEANPLENWTERWLWWNVENYARTHPEHLNYVTNKARIFVPGRGGLTIPEPDLTGYKDFPVDQPLSEVRWDQLNPVLAAEIMGNDPEKDLVRNVKLFLAVPTIKEYWVFDILKSPDEPSLQVHRRHGKKWRIIDVPFGDTYTTTLLPGFELLIDPRK
jgi:Uma2 family endonuclease